MNTIWKYPVPINDYFELEMPQGAEILTVQMQYNEPQLWALVDKMAPRETRSFRLAGTGHPIDDPRLDYIGTVQMMEGQLVWHIFEISHPAAMVIF